MEVEKGNLFNPRFSGLSLLRDIAAGRYGEEVRRIHNRMYAIAIAWFVSTSLLACLLVAA
jgi:hypothetical protein